MRNEVLIVLITFCLTATLFSIIPVGSQGVREYDPWYDINDDGKIDLKDYFGVGLKYGTEGDSTKNVNVTNWPETLEPKTIIVCQNLTVITNASGYYFPFAEIDVAPFSHVSIFVTYKNDNWVRKLYYASTCLGISGEYSEYRVIQLDKHNWWYETAATDLAIGGSFVSFRLFTEAAGSTELTIVLYCYN